MSNFCRFANGARCQDIDQVLLHGYHFLLSALSSSSLKSSARTLLFGVNYRLQFTGLGRKERKVWSRPALCRKLVKSFALFFACWSVKFDRWVRISARWGKQLSYSCSLRWKKSLQSYCSVDFDFLASVRSYHNTNYDAICYDLWWHVAWRL